MSTSAVVLVIAMALTGCGDGSPSSPEPPPNASTGSAGPPGEATGATVELRFDTTSEYRDLDLRWLELEDSRCPIGVTCVWAGQIVVTLEVTRGEDDPVELELVNRLKGEPEAGRAFDHELRLLGVDPHPKYGVTPDRSAYVARLEITEL